MANGRIAVVQFGLGEIGRSIARLVHEKPSLKLVGAVDVAPDLVGRDLAEVIGVEPRLDAPVSADAHIALGQARPDIVVVATSSSLRAIYEQIVSCLRAGANVVSTCEELVFPSEANRQLWDELDEAARAAGVTVLGTGVNPGFAMDALPVFVSTVCERVDAIRIVRRQEASTRRLALQRKAGIGLSLEEFWTEAADGKLGHVGLRESALMIADRLKLSIDRLSETLEPNVADNRIADIAPHVRPGAVAGIHQTVVGTENTTERLRLVLDIGVNGMESRDEIHIDGNPPIDLVLTGGLHGDVATRAVVVNTIPRVVGAAPGLITMSDLRLPSAVEAT